VAAEQVKQLLRRLPERNNDAPLFVFDAGYDPVRLQQRLEGCGAQMLVRLRSGRCLYADPPPPASDRAPAPSWSEALETKDPTTWPAPSEENHCEDPAYGTVEVGAWANLHPKVQCHENRGTALWTDAHRAGHVGFGGSFTPSAAHSTAAYVVAVVARCGRTRPRAPLASLRQAFRPRAHLPLLQTDALVDNSSPQASRAGRPLQLADVGHLHAALRLARPCVEDCGGFPGKEATPLLI
jgi:hypothetical protein